MRVSRRDVLMGMGAAAIAGKLPAAAMPTRPLGKTGWMTSILGVGTAEIPADAEAIRALNRLIDGGVNYVDTAPSYTATRSESVLGQVLPSRRKEVFLATKTLARDADGAYAEIQQSLSRLQVKQIDLLQLHAINDAATLDAVLKGAVKGLERARKEGMIRHIGITGHTRPEVIMAALEKYPFDSILVPLSALDAHIHDFATEVVPKANQLGISVVGMKSLKGIERAKGTEFDPQPFIRYAMSLPVSTTIVGLRREVEVDQNLRTAKSHVKMSVQERRELEQRFKIEADTGHLWWKAQ